MAPKDRATIEGFDPRGVRFLPKNGNVRSGVNVDETASAVGYHFCLEEEFFLATPFYRLIRGFLRLVLPIWVRVDSEGLDRLPAGGPFLLCPNHLSVLDPPLLAAMIARPITFLAAGYLFEIPVLGTILRWAGVLPLGGPVQSRRSLAEATRVLEAGGTVALFPEGGVRRAVAERLEKGAGFLAVRTGSPLYPVLIRGTDRILPTGRYLPRRGHVRVVVGEPIRGVPGSTSRDLVEELAASLQNLAR